MNTRKISRREFMRGAGIGALALLGSQLSLLRQPAAALAAAPQPQMMEPFMPDAEVLITSGEKWVQILPGAQTRVWGYEGQLLSGSGVTVQTIPGSYLGPIIRA